MRPGRRSARACRRRCRACARILGHRGPFGVGLRLSARAARSSSSRPCSTHFALPSRRRYYVLTINGFPYGAFHGQRVKEQRYRPDWREMSASTTPTGSHGCWRRCWPIGRDRGQRQHGPRRFRSEIAGRADAAMADRLLGMRRTSVDLRERDRRDIALAIEPEPACYIETVDEAVAILPRAPVRRRRSSSTWPRDGVALTRRRRPPPHRRSASTRATWRWSSKSPATASIADRAGIRVCKVQISSASAWMRDARAMRALDAFADGVYLHQVVERAPAGVTR